MTGQITQEQLEYLKKIKLWIGLPAYGGITNVSTMVSFMEIVDVLLFQYGINVRVVPLTNESLITRGRNRLTHQYLQTDYTHLMWIDADVAFSAYDIIHMLLADKDIIGACYSKKELNFELLKKVLAVKPDLTRQEMEYALGSFTFNAVPDAANKAQSIDQPIEVLNIATGFLIIKRNVFETMIEKQVVTPHVCLYEKADDVYNFWNMGYDSNNIELSEDYYFCLLARGVGFQIFLKADVVLEHFGSYFFKGSIPFLANIEGLANRASNNGLN